ncbi:AAA family ATPase [candidate division KSB1 bacterium]|nr:AAA family ATPase [candidate division KSB1 bacterium]
MTHIIFEGVRCFYHRHQCPIKPITLLLGENSSGKTTFLALTRLAWDIATGNLSEDIFNAEPFLLGAYEQIASLRGGKAGRAKSFFIGQQIEVELGSGEIFQDFFGKQVQITAQFTSQGSQSKLDEWIFKCGHFNLTATPSIQMSHTDIPTATLFDITITTPRGSLKIPGFPPFHNLIQTNNFFDLIAKVVIIEQSGKKQQPIITDKEGIALQSISNQVFSSRGLRPYAFAPIRTRPQRTYDPLKDVPKPEGSHVPMVLARIFSEKSESSEKLRRAIETFGKMSGLFKSVEVKRKGQKESDPFQLSVKTAGQAFNLVDVGYGVSQVLPIIVDVIQNPTNSTFLLQQPEVHLHPRAQAELGSFLATFAKEENKCFVIETHSDYLIDRIRMDIREKKNLSPEDVSILYFEGAQGSVEIHPLRIDEFGNIVNTPSTYRQFFMQEERRMFGI